MSINNYRSPYGAEVRKNLVHRTTTESLHTTTIKSPHAVTTLQHRTTVETIRIHSPGSAYFSPRNSSNHPAITHAGAKGQQRTHLAIGYGAESVEQSDSEGETWSPPNAEFILNNIRKMYRQNKGGTITHSSHLYTNPSDMDPRIERYHMLVFLYLSINNTGENALTGISRLKNKILTPQRISQSSMYELESALNVLPNGKDKAVGLKAFSRVLYNDYNSDVPETFEEVEALPGIDGRLAHLVMYDVWNINSGMSVDENVHRVAQRLNLTQERSNSWKETRLAIQEWLPVDEWANTSASMVWFGKVICTFRDPKCFKCPNRTVCPSCK